MRYTALLFAVVWVGACTTATEQSTAIPEEDLEIDYSDASNWLCHPSKASDACDVDLSTTIVEPSGRTSLETADAAENPAFDCFYVYPTVSLDPTPNSDMVANVEERRVIAQQFARFGTICRTYAPLYRQVTLTHLRSFAATGEYKADPTLNYEDVKRAWQTYLAEENDGRGVVLLGHSQGAGLITRLTAEEIAGSEVEKRIISVMPIGTNIYPNEDGSYPLPPCTTSLDTACMVGYVSFRGDREPPADSRFGKTRPPAGRALCVNPAELSGDGDELYAYLAKRAFTSAVEMPFGEGVEVSTDFVSLPGLLRARCAENATHTWLAIDIHADPADPRADDISGDVIVDGEVRAEWGFHLIDMNVAMGSLLKLAKAQAGAWQAAQNNF